MFELSMTNILLILIIVLQLTLLFVGIRQNKRLKRLEEGNAPSSIPIAATTEQKDAPMESGIVFCRNCGNPFNSDVKVCPTCKVER